MWREKRKFLCVHYKYGVPSRIASQGCPILNSNLRDQIDQSGDNKLRVVK